MYVRSSHGIYAREAFVEPCDEVARPRLHLLPREVEPIPKYFSFKIAGYFLYLTSTCIIEAFLVHASDRRLSERGLA